MIHLCKCHTKFEYDDWDWNKDIRCPNCKQKYNLECEQNEPDFDHEHYLVEDNND